MTVCAKHAFGFWPGCQVCEAGKVAKARTELRETLQATVEELLSDSAEPDPEKRISRAAVQINGLIEKHLRS